MGRTGSHPAEEKHESEPGCSDSLMSHPTADTNPLVRPASLSWRRQSGLVQSYLSNERTGQHRTKKWQILYCLVVPMGQLVAPLENHTQRETERTEEQTGFCPDICQHLAKSIDNLTKKQLHVAVLYTNLI